MAEEPDRLKDIFDNDPFGLLDVKPQRSSAMTEVERLVQSFEEVSAFYDEHGREPRPDTDDEFHLHARLAGIRESPDKVSVLAPYDRHGLLDGYGAEPPGSIEELLESDAFGLLDDDAAELFDLQNVPASPETPDYVAQRRPCPDFERFRPLLERCQAELERGERRTMTFSREKGIEVGDFFILRGLLTYVADKRDPVMKDGELNYRLRCIFSNGTESDLLMLSLARDLYRHGRRVSRADELNLGLDDPTGFVYVLRSLSDNVEIEGFRDLYKIGYSRGSVEDRISNAERSPTYLMAPVRIVETFEVNVNVSKLEHLLHVFFDPARVEVHVVGEDGEGHMANEWFDVPLESIENAVHYLVNGDILDYRYDPNRRQIVPR